MTEEDKKSLAKYVLKKLKATFPDAQIELNYKKGDAWQLLVVVALSAQTTDKKVNQISKELFKRFKKVKDFANASPSDIEPYIKSLGLFHNKARNLVLAAKKIMDDFEGSVPKTRSELETLAGVGHKTSAVIVSNAFGVPAIAVDTHVSRIARRLGLTHETDTKKIEDELTRLFSPQDLLDAHHCLIFHGRRICFAKKPHCSICPLERRCPKIGVMSSQ